MESSAPIHSVEELWAIREKVSGSLVWIDEFGNVQVDPSFEVFTNEVAAEAALEDNYGPEWYEVVRIIVGGADGR